MILLIIIAAIYLIANIFVVVEYNISEPFWKYKKWGLFFGVLFNLLMLLFGSLLLGLITSSEYLHERANKKW